MNCTSQPNVKGKKASLASYFSIVVPCSGLYSSTIIDYDLLENISRQVPFHTDSLRSRNELKGIRVETVIVSRRILSELAQNVGAKRYPLAIRLIEYLRAKGLLSLLTGFSFSFIRKPSCREAYRVLYVIRNTGCSRP